MEATMEQQPPSLPEQMRHDIESSLNSRRAQPNTGARRLEDGAKRAGTSVWSALRRHPYIGVGGVTALGVFAGSMIGVAEITLGVMVGYAAYKVLRGGEKPAEAIGEVVKDLEHL
jgi:hypothetical protein